MFSNYAEWILIVVVVAQPVAVFAGRNWLKTRIEKSIQFGFDKRLDAIRSELRNSEEQFRSQLRQRESEISLLRENVYNAQAARTSVMDKKKIDAVESLWIAAQDIGKYEWLATFLTTIKLENVAKSAPTNPKLRTFVDVMTGCAELNASSIPRSSVEQLYLTEVTWACFSAYRLVAMIALMQAHSLKSGLHDAHKMVKMDSVNKTIAQVLPHRSNYINEYPDIAVFSLMDELRQVLLKELHGELDGKKYNDQDIKTAAAIMDGVRAVEKEARPKSYDLQGSTKM